MVLNSLKGLGCHLQDLIEVLKLRVLSVLEQAVPWWAPMVTKSESSMIERVLKTGLHIIFAENNQNTRNPQTER